MIMTDDNRTHTDRRRLLVPTHTYTNPHKHPSQKHPSLYGLHDTQYQLDYNHNHRPICVWNGTTHTDIVYDDDDDYDCRTDHDYANGDSSNMNDPSVRLQFTQCLQTVQFQNHLQAAPKHTQTIPQQTTQYAHKSKHTTMKKHNKEDPAPYMYDTLQLLFLTTHYETTSNNDYYTEEFPLYTVPQYITGKKHPSHDNYLYR